MHLKFQNYSQKSLILACFFSLLLSSCQKQTLQDRSKAFLKKPIPKEMDYVSGSITESVIIEYAEHGKITVNEELHEALQLILMDWTYVEDATPGSEDEYLNESYIILQEIFKELNSKT